MENILTIYELEPIGEGNALEATGRVYHFCSDLCREIYATEQLRGVDFKTGDSPDAIKGTVCDECGTELKAA